MALIECAECSNQVSDKAAACPKCGAPIAPVATTPEPAAKQTVKRAGGVYEGVGFLLIVGGMIAAMAGAGGIGGAAILAGFVVFIIGRFN